MKRFAALLISLITIICFAACDSSEDTTSTPEVIINTPTDNTVNGYRTSEPESSKESQMPDIITGGEASAGTVSVAKPDKGETDDYCANKNSKVFHKSSCSSVKTIKESNKQFSSDRAALISQGYTPCKKCEP